jgi:protocatechuate 3,4-dioxygenase beta subunit
VTGCLLAALVAAQVGQSSAADLRPDPTATLGGTIVRADGQPLPRARVTLDSAATPGRPRTAITDDAGAYLFDMLSAGEYRVRAAKTGYMVVEYGQRRADERGGTIRLDAGETRERVDITLPRYGAISGVIVDENGDPVEAVGVSVLEVHVVGGRRQLTPVAGVGSRRTNELGRYRVYGLQPGAYVVSAELGPLGTDDVAGYAPTYFPGTPNPVDAQMVSVDLGEDVLAADFALTPVRTARIAGRTLDSSGEPFQGGVQMRSSRRSGAVAMPAVGAWTSPDGSFEFRNVPPGQYVIHAFKGNEFGWQSVAINGTDMTDLAVQTLPGSTVTGRMVFEGASAPSRRRLDLALIPADPDFVPFGGGGLGADIHDDWTFTIANASGARRFRMRTAPPGWMLKSIRSKAGDITDAVMSFGTGRESLQDVEVVLTDQVTHVSGAVTDGRGAPANCAVVAFSSDRSRWFEASRFFALRRPSADGTFRIDGLPPDEYYLAAVDQVSGDDDGGDWQDPEFLDRLSRNATKVMLTDGERLSVSLTAPATR